jgi:subtilisin family serine protease
LKKPLLLIVCLLALASAGGAATTTPGSSPVTEVVVTLSSPSLTNAFQSQPLSYGAASRGKRLNLRSLASRRYLDRLASSQATLSRRIEARIPGASVRWHYRIVANGLAVSLPSDEVSLLSELPGVEHVYPSYRYRALDTSVPGNVSAIGASDLWQSDLSNAGQGIKIGIIDDGIDQTHSYFDPTAYTYPVGYPQGNTAYTTAKVIVARAFAPSGLKYANASLPVDPKYSSHGTFVAGIAAGNAGTTAVVDGKTKTLSGVAPSAYLGNYKALTIPTEQFGLNGNSPEIVAAIEAAVSDGMNVINLSIGEPEIEPHNDVVAKAVNAASAAGVVVVAAAGNEYGENGKGSVGSPGSAASAITVGASSSASTASGEVRIASFSSAGPTPYGLLLKPSVSAPGVDILSSASNSEGSWSSESGTSAASPHVAGAVALLRQLHPNWTVSQIKSSLVLTATPITSSSGRELSPLREGGGRIAVLSASQPLVFASPSSVGFGLVKRGISVTRAVTLSDADVPVGSCQVRIQHSESTSGASLQAPASVAVPGTLSLKASAKASAKEGDLDGWIILTCAGQERRIPFWLHVAVSRLGEKKKAGLARPGVYQGNTKGETALVSHYLYPELAPGVHRLLRGPEQVFRFSLPSSRQNFGVVVLSRARGVSVSPRIVRGDNESKLAGLAALPINVNPYLDSFDTTEPVAGVLRPAAGVYYIVFDTTSAKKAGRFRFRFWVNDVTPPRLRTLSRRAGMATVKITDRGSGVDPKSILATVGKHQLALSFDSCTGKAIIDARSLGVGKHTLVLSASDYQESKNNENSSRLLPNTAELTVSISVARADLNRGLR